MGSSRIAASFYLGFALAALTARAQGDDWALVAGTPPRVMGLSRIDDTLFAATDTGNFRLGAAETAWKPYAGKFPLEQPITGSAGDADFRVFGGAPALIVDSTLLLASDSSLYRYGFNGMNWVPWKLTNPGVGSLGQPFFHHGILLVPGSNGVAKSLDGGETWMKSLMPAGIPTFTSFLARGDTLYAGVSSAPADSLFPSVSIPSPAPLGGLFRSLDGGMTWSPLKTPASGNPMVRLPVSDQGPLIMVMTDSLFVSMDAGATWRERGPALLRGGGPNLPVHYDGRTLLVHRGNSFSVSRDAGASWSQRTLADSVGGNSHYPIYMGVTESALWLASDDKLYASRDFGLTWAKTGGDARPNRMQADGKNLLIRYFSGSPSWSLDDGATWKGPNSDRVIRNAVKQGSLVWAGTLDGIFRSQDGGINWVRDGLDGKDIRDLSLRGKGPGLLAADSNGVFAKDPTLGGDWNRILPNVTRAQTVSGEGEIVAVSADTGWYISMDGGQSSAFQPRAEVGSSPAGSSLLVFGRRIWAVKSEKLYQIQVNAGKLAWSPQALGKESGLPTLLHGDIGQYRALLAGRPYFLLGTANGLYQSADSGRTWKPSPSPLGGQPIVRMIRMGDRIAAMNEAGAWVTDDGGQSWTKTDTSTGYERYNVRPMQASEEMAVLAVSDSVRILSREGKWSAAGYPKDVHDEIDPQVTVIGTTLLLVDKRGLYRSEDKGAAWTALKSACIEFDLGVAGKNLMAWGQPDACPDPARVLSSRALLISQDTGRTWRPLAPGLFTPQLSTAGMAMNVVDGMILMEQDSIIHASSNGTDWMSRPGRLGAGLFAPAATRLYRADIDGIHVLSLLGGSIAIADRRALPPQPRAGPQFARSRFETLASPVYFPAQGRFALTVTDVRGQSHRVRNLIQVDQPGIQWITWKAPAPGYFLLRFQPR